METKKQTTTGRMCLNCGYDGWHESYDDCPAFGEGR